MKAFCQMVRFVITWNTNPVNHNTKIIVTPNLFSSSHLAKFNKYEQNFESVSDICLCFEHGYSSIHAFECFPFFVITLTIVTFFVLSWSASARSCSTASSLNWHRKSNHSTDSRLIINYMWAILRDVS